MKKLLAALLMLLVMMGASALASEETVKFKSLVVDKYAEEIDLGKVVVDPSEGKKFYEFLASLPNLKKVDMFATRMNGERIDKLVARFPDIEFGWTISMNGYTLRTDMTVFSTRHSGDTKNRISSKSASVLRWCKNMLALDLGHNNIDDLSFLYEMPHLKVLILVDNTFQDITPIASLKELEYLEIFYNKVRDISPLAEMHSLVDLNICYNLITDISPVMNLTGLQRLWMGNYMSRNPSKKVDPAIGEAVQAALPNTTVDYWSSSVKGGWRDKGTHYDVISRIFAKGGEYEPFDDVNHDGDADDTDDADRE